MLDTDTGTDGNELGMKGCLTVWWNEMKLWTYRRLNLKNGAAGSPILLTVLRSLHDWQCWDMLLMRLQMVTWGIYFYICLHQERTRSSPVTHCTSAGYSGAEEFPLILNDGQDAVAQPVETRVRILSPPLISDVFSKCSVHFIRQCIYLRYWWSTDRSPRPSLAHH